MYSLKLYSRNFMTAVSLFLCVLFVLSSVMTSLAWFDFTQTKTNIFRGTVDNVTVVLHLVEKDVNGVISADPVRPIMNAEFQLYRIEPDGTETLIPGGPWYTDMNGQIILDGRDEAHPKLDSGKYVFVETKPAFGYTYDRDEAENNITRYEFEITQADASSNKTVTVPAYNRRGSGTLAVKKTVTGEAPADAVFAFTITFSDNGTYSYSIDGGEKIPIASGGTLTLSHGQTALFEDIPIGVQYRVVETPLPDYVISSSDHQGSITEAGSVAAFVNAYEPNPVPGETVKLTVTKKLAGEYPNGDANKEFSFTLIVDGEKLSFTLKPDEVKEFVLPQGAQYEILEEDYFAKGYDASISNGFGTASGEEINVVVTNTFVADPVVDIVGEKYWVLGDNAVALPEQITVRLKNGDTVVLEKTVKPDANGDWKYSFTAPKYDASGNEIDYTVEELPVEGFKTVYDGYDITNEYLTPVSWDPPVVTKFVEGENIPETVFNFTMQGQNGAPMPEGSTGSVKTVSVTGSGEVALGEITFTNPGVYTYTIVERNNGAENWTYDRAKYTLTVTVVEQDGTLTVSEQKLEKNGEAAEAVAFTNTYVEPPANTVTVQGRKVWHHGTNPVENHPESIVVYVYADGKLAGQWQVSAGDNWTYSFELPKYAADGHEIVYTVDEKEIDGYTKQIDGYDLINTYIEPPVPDESDEPVEPTLPTDAPSTETPSTDAPTTDAPTTDTPTTDAPSTDTPSTGDNSNLGFWFVLMILSLLGLIATALLGRSNYGYVGKYCDR